MSWLRRAHQMLLAPGDHIVEIVARGDAGAGQKQQHLAERIVDPPRLAPVLEPGKCCNSKATRARGASQSTANPVKSLIACALLESARQGIIFPASMQNRR